MSDSDFELVDVQDSVNNSPKNERLGQRVELKWSSGRWYRGTICDYDAQEDKHFVHYDDGDKKWYNLAEMVVRFVEENDEWIDIREEQNKKAMQSLQV